MCMRTCLVQAWQHQPPPFLQQPPSLRRHPTSPTEVSEAVQRKVAGMSMMSQHGQGDMQDIQNLMTAALSQVLLLLSLHLPASCHQPLSLIG